MSRAPSRLLPLVLFLSLGATLAGCDSAPKERIYPPMQAVPEIAPTASNQQRVDDAPMPKADLDRLLAKRSIVIEHLKQGDAEASRELRIDPRDRSFYLPDRTCKIGGGAIGYLAPVFNVEGRMQDRLTCPEVTWDYIDEPMMIDYRSETKFSDGVLNIRGEWTITQKRAWNAARSGEIRQNRIEAAIRLTPTGCEVLSFRQELHNETGPPGSISSFAGRGVENLVVEKIPSTSCRAG